MFARLPNLRVVLALALYSCASAGSHHTARPTGHVVSWAPAEVTFNEAAPLEVMFDVPVVEEEMVGKVVDSALVELDPAADVEFRFRDRQTLVIQPQTPLHRGTRYTLTLADELPLVVDPEEREHTFVVEPLELMAVEGAELNWFAPQGELAIRFNIPVAVSEAIAHCAFEGGSASVGLSAIEPDQVSERVRVRPETPLEQGGQYQLSCSGVTADGGNEPMMEDSRGLRVYPRAGIVSASPSASSRVTPDELTIEIVTQTPVSLEQIRERVRLRPTVPGFSEHWVNQGPTRWTQVVNLEASSDYRIVIAEGLQDQFGQELGERFETRFSTTDAAPRVHMETGIYAVEAEGPGYPIWSRNVGTIAVQCAFVPKRRIPALLTTGMDYDPWYSSRHREIDWESLGLRPRTVQIAAPQSLNRWQQHDVDFTERCGGRGKRGMYLAEVRSTDVEQSRAAERYWQYPYRVLGNVTDLGVLLKVGPSSGLVWVASISEGKPVAGATATLYDTRGRRVHRGVTDADGLLRLPGSHRLLRQRRPGDRGDVGEEESWDWDWRSQRLIVVVEKDGDLAAVDGNWQNGIQIWNFGHSRDARTGGEEMVRGMLMSDRGIYRPGETAHFKGLVRTLQANRSPNVPRGRASVHIEDARGNQVFERRFRLSAFGSFDFDFPLSTEAPVGDYYVRATFNERTFATHISVQEFRPASFEITERQVSQGNGEERRLGYNASYLFGAPVADAEAEWTVMRRPHWVRFDDYPSYSFEDWSSLDDSMLSYFWSRYGGGERYVGSGTTRTDRRGDLTVEVSDPEELQRMAHDYLVSVNVRDPSGQTIGKRSVQTVYPTDMLLGLHTQEYVQAVGMPFSVNAVALTTEGQRIASDARLTYIRRDQECSPWVPRQGRTCSRSDTEVWSRRIELREGGVSTERIVPEEAGRFLIKLEGRDRHGRPVVASSMVWIIGEGEAFWSGDESARMSLIANKRTYSPGDVARLVPQAPVGGALALVTTERSGIMDARVVRLGSGIPAIELPIEDAHAPNVYVSVAAIRGRTSNEMEGRPFFAMGISNLEVDSDAKRLEIAVEPESEAYRPGDTVRGRLRVTRNGRPVRAEVVLSVADEGVLQLIGFKTPDPMTTFYRTWNLGVENGTNWNRIARQRPPLGWQEGESGDDGPSSDVRTRFVSSAFWAPSLITNDDGVARFEFEAPDNLTAFRLMAVAADTSDSFGSADRRIQVRKELMATPVLPRFFHEGDRLKVGVVVHNHTDEDGEVLVRGEATGLWMRDPERRVQVPAHGSARVLFGARVSDRRDEARVRFSAELGRFTDAFERALPIRRHLIEEQTLLAGGAVGSATTVSTQLSIPESAMQQESRLEITVDQAGMAELAPSLQYLIRYPYGCLEQTTSGLVGLFQVADLARSMRFEGMHNHARLRTYMRLGVDKVLRHQHANGHFSLWPSTDTAPHLTAYALWGLSEAKEAGVRVRQDALDKGLDALRTWALERQRANANGHELGTMAMAAYVLAVHGQPNEGLNATLYEKRSSLTHYAKAFLAMAMHRSRSNNRPSAQIAQLISELSDAAQTQGEGAMIRETATSWYFSTDVRSTALTLSALVDIEPTHDLVERLARGLRSQRAERGYWRSTIENAYALIGLADYARLRTSTPVTVTVKAGNRQLVRRQLRDGAALHLSRSLARLEPSEITVETSGAAHYAIRRVVVRRPTEDDAQANGFGITSEILDYETKLPVEEARVGQLLRLQVQVSSPERREQVAVRVPLPAGFEVVNPDFATEPVPGVESLGRRRWGWRWTHTELRDEEARAFSDEFLGAGVQHERVLQVLVRATQRGTFTAPGAYVEAMYAPELNARAPMATVRIR